MDHDALRKHALAFAAAVLLVGAFLPAHAGDITSYANGPWLEFAFYGAGTDALSCAGICYPAGNAVTADAPPWTFTAGPQGATVTIVDAFFTGDVFQLWDNGFLVGQTSNVTGGVYCGASAEDCLAAMTASSGVFPLGAGPHSLTIRVVVSVYGAGAAYFRVDGDVPGVPPPPQDTDGDGIPDALDQCPMSDLSPTVVVERCDSGVPNLTFPDGCTLADLVHQCSITGIRNHGMQVSCVAGLLNGLRKARVLLPNEGAPIEACAAQSRN